MNHHHHLHHPESSWLCLSPGRRPLEQAQKAELYTLRLSSGRAQPLSPPDDDHDHVDDHDDDHDDEYVDEDEDGDDDEGEDDQTIVKSRRKAV